MAKSSYPKLTAISKKSGDSSAASVAVAGPPGKKPKAVNSTKQASMLNLLKVDPNDSPDQKKLKEKHNEMAATVFNNNRVGSSGIKNHTPYGGPEGQKAGKAISVLAIDPVASQKADSVRTLMVKKYKKK